MIGRLGEVIRFHRKKSGLTQKELAELAGVGKNLVYALEKGSVTVRLENLLRVLDILNIEFVLHSPLMDTFHREYGDETSEGEI